MAHFVEQAVCNLELVGAEDVSEGDVVGEDGGAIEGDVVDPIEEGEGALPVGFAGEEGDHEARGELTGFEGGEDGEELVLVGGLGKGIQEIFHVYASI